MHGSENVNTIVSRFINNPDVSIEHIIAQKDVVFSNSMVEALNKVIKHQFLFPQEITNGIRLRTILDASVHIYNTIRPQMSLSGNTPEESFHGIPSNFDTYKASFVQQKQLRRIENKKNRCKGCI